MDVWAHLGRTTHMSKVKSKAAHIRYIYVKQQLHFQGQGDGCALGFSMRTVVIRDT